LDDHLQPCFDSRLGRCLGACEGREDPETYNQRVLEAIKPWQFHSPDFFILERGKNQEEMAVVKIARNKYMGYGYISTEIGGASMDALHDCIQSRKDNWEVRTLIRGYLKKNHRLVKIVEF